MNGLVFELQRFADDTNSDEKVSSVATSTDTMKNFFNVLKPYQQNLDDPVMSLTEGTTLNSDDEELYYRLETAGIYTLNGLKITTTADDVKVQFADNDTIILTA